MTVNEEFAASADDRRVPRYARRCDACENNLPRVNIGGVWKHPSGGPHSRLCGFQESVTRRGDWVQTFTGRQFFAFDPRPEDFHILDIAAGMRNPRYSSQSTLQQSVAEHCVLMWRVARERGLAPRQRRAVLMHDASECVLVDVPRPIKRDLSDYAGIEDAIMRAVAVRYDFDWPIDPVVKELDNDILNDECAQNLSPPPQPWRQLSGRPLGVKIECWPADRAMILFLQACALEGMI